MALIKGFLPLFLLAAIVFAQENPFVLDYDTALALAQLPLECYDQARILTHLIHLTAPWQDYPHNYGITFNSDDDFQPPLSLHPSFGGCFDWHSAVHGQWTLAVLLNRFPGTELAESIEHVLNEQLTDDKIDKELRVFDDHPTFERTYGWAWLLKLRQELLSNANWGDALDPLSRRIVQIYADYLPNLLYPLREGEHANTAFSIILATEYADGTDEWKV